MIQTQQFKAIRTESGKWISRNYEWGHKLCNVTFLVDDAQLEACDKECVEDTIGVPIHIVTVALVDPRYIKELERLESQVRFSLSNASDEMKSISPNFKVLQEIDRLRAEGGT